MRTEDIVDFSFFALFVSAFAVTISGSRDSPTSRRALRRSWGLGLISGVLIAFGLVNFQFIHNSPCPVVDGNLWDVRHLYSNHTHSTQFMITDAAGHAVLVRCSYSGPGFVQGARARVRYVAYNRKLVDMDMLTGPYQAWHLHESPESVCWAWVCAGAVCGIIAFDQTRMATQGADDGNKERIGT